MSSLLISALCEFLKSNKWKQTFIPLKYHLIEFNDFMLKVYFNNNDVEFIIFNREKSIRMSKRVFKWFIKRCVNYKRDYHSAKWECVISMETFKQCKTEFYFMKMFGKQHDEKTFHLKFSQKNTANEFFIDEGDIYQLCDFFNSIIKWKM